MFQIVPAETAGEICQARDLFREYQESIGVPLCFQKFEEELQTLPGAYKPPGGGLFLALSNGHVVGCVGYRPFKERTCELKRLYVKPNFRRSGVGRELVKRVLDASKASGYESICLDTLSSMKAAMGLYLSFGFCETEPYYPNPLEEVVYFRRKLT